MPLKRGGARHGLVVLIVLVMGSGSASAQAWDDFQIERFRLAMDGGGILDVDWADVPGHKSWGLGLWVGFARDPLVLYDRTMPGEPRAGALVEQRVTTGLVGSIALWQRLELGVGFQAVANQASGSMTDAVMGLDSLASAGAGDVRLAPKLLVIGGGGSRVHVAIVPAVTYPVGAAGDFLREAGPTFAPELVVSAGGTLRISANLGYRMRERFEVADLVIDDELFARLGVGYRIGGTREDAAVELDASGSFATAVEDAQANQRSLEAMGGLSVRLSRALRMFAAGGIGLDRGFGTPEYRALAGVRVQGVRGDRDGDGREDVSDRCPNAAEDKDGFEDQDGCPDLDNDGDGVADTLDKAPNQPEDRDGFEDEDGAPDPDNDGDGFADAADKCPGDAEDKDGIRDDDGCPDASGKVVGKVVDSADQRAIPAATVVVEMLAGGAPVTVSTADDGTFTADVTAGALQLKVTARGYTLGAAPAKVGEGESTDVTITMVRATRQGQLKGQVLSFNGKPLAATIVVHGSSKTLTTDADGFFAVDLPQGKYKVSIASKGHKPQTRSIEVKLDRVTVLNVDMQKGKR